MRLICTQCEREQPFGSLGSCPACDGILRPVYPDTAVAQLAQIPSGHGIDRYRPLLPVQTAVPHLGEGDTPLLRSQAIGPELGLDRVTFKNEGLNPSGAFKDRAGALVAALAREAGARGVLTASSGNASAAIAAYCAAADLTCTVLLEPGNPAGKLRQTVAAGARVLPVEGLFSRGPEPVQRLMHQVATAANQYLAFVWAPVNPYILEGIKTIAYELTAQLPGVPDRVICPVGGGDMFTALWRGFLELKRAGVSDRLPRMTAVQSFRAPPLLTAYQQNSRQVPTLPAAISQISGINVPFSGDHALAVVYESAGNVIGVNDEEVFSMQAQLAQTEGIWVEPAGAVSVAALARLREAGKIQRGERIVCILSGAGFKDGQLAAKEATAVGQESAIHFNVDEIVRMIR